MPSKNRTKRRGSPASDPSDQAPRPSRIKPVPMPRLLTVDEVAELLRTTRKAIYCMIQRGKIPGVIRLSRRLLVDSVMLLGWIDEHRTRMVPPPKLP